VSFRSVGISMIVAAWNVDPPPYNPGVKVINVTTGPGSIIMVCTEDGVFADPPKEKGEATTSTEEPRVCCDARLSWSPTKLLRREPSGGRRPRYHMRR